MDLRRGVAAGAGAATAPPPLVSSAALMRAQVPQEGIGPLRMVRALVLLGGSVRQSEFRKTLGRSIFDLPVDAHGRTLLDVWCEQTASLARAVRWDDPQVRLMIDQHAPEPRAGQSPGGVRVRTQLDPVELRGTGGILRDVSDEYADDEYLLVANAAQLLREPLIRSAAMLASSGGDVSVVAHDDGSPSGLALLRCGALRLIRSTGYIDFKEQVLPQVAASHCVKVRRLPSSSAALPIRGLSDYIAALRARHADNHAVAGRRLGSDPLDEAWSALFAIAENPADIHPTAELYDSVVLRGGRVERNAVVVRSIVCRDAVVPAGVTVLNRVVGGRTTAAWTGGGLRKSWPFQTEQSSEFLA